LAIILDYWVNLTLEGFTGALKPIFKEVRVGRLPFLKGFGRVAFHLGEL